MGPYALPKYLSAAILEYVGIVCLESYPERRTVPENNEVTCKIGPKYFVSDKEWRRRLT